MGTDVINSLTTWKNYEEIKEYPIINAHRPGYEINKELEDIYNIVDETSTYDDISSTIIRNLLDTKPEEILDKEYMTKNAYLKLYGAYK
jgi:nicotinic acid mononucleotide adenylyltransferase